MNAPVTDQPILTMAFPLYRSGIFVSNIQRQIKKLLRPGYQVIISDRHGLDNSIEILQQTFGADDRFVFVSQTDACNWVQHHNDLIRAAAGKYFMWISHDDDYEADYCDKLLAHLETHPDVKLAAGLMNTQKHPFYSQSLLQYSYQDIDFINHHFPYSTGQLLRLIKSSNTTPLWNGIMKRDFIVDNHLFIRYSQNCISYVEFYWIFGLAMAGQLNYLPQAQFTKHFHPLCLHSQWRHNKYKLTGNREAPQILFSYVGDAPISPIKKIVLMGGLSWFIAKKKIYLLNKNNKIFKKNGSKKQPC